MARRVGSRFFLAIGVLKAGQLNEFKDQIIQKGGNKQSDEGREASTSTVSVNLYGGNSAGEMVVSRSCVRMSPEMCKHKWDSVWGRANPFT